MARPRNPVKLLEHKLVDVIYMGRDAVDNDGNPVKVTATAADFGNLIRYLQLTGRIRKQSKQSPEAKAMARRASELGLPIPGQPPPGMKRPPGRPRNFEPAPIDQDPDIAPPQSGVAA